jgi:hypothetical protein
MLRAAVALCCLVAGSASAQEFDGTYWHGMTEQNRLGYVIGFTEGLEFLSLAGPVVICLPGPAEKLEGCVRNNVKALEGEIGRFRGVTFGQLKDGLDTFYSDYRNRRIKIRGAINHVTRAIAGEPAADLERSVEMMRKANAN